MEKLSMFVLRFVCKPFNFSVSSHIRLLQQNYSNQFFNSPLESRDKWNEIICFSLCQIGRIELLEWSLANKITWDWKNMYYNAAKQGNLDIIKWGRKRRYDDTYSVRYYGFPFHATDMWSAAASNGKINVLEYLYEHCLPINYRSVIPTNVCSLATIGGFKETLLWLFEHNFPYDLSDIFIGAVRSGQVELLKWFVEFIGPIIIQNLKDTNEFKKKISDNVFNNRFLSRLEASNSNLELIKLNLTEHDQNRICFYAIELNKFDFIEWLQTNRFKFYTNPDNYYAAAKTGNIFIFEWLIQIGCNFELANLSSIWEISIQEGHLHLLHWLIKNNYLIPFQHLMMSTAVIHGHLSIMKLLYRRGCPLSCNSCASGSASRNINIIKWLRKKKCDWDETTMMIAISNNDSDMVQWLYENGCPMGKSAIFLAKNSNSKKIRRYFLSQNMERVNY